MVIMTRSPQEVNHFLEVMGTMAAEKHGESTNFFTTYAYQVYAVLNGNQDEYDGGDLRRHRDDDTDETQ